MDLRRAAFFNSFYMMLGNGGQLVASLGVFLYLARILSPADFGAMGVAAALVDLLTVFGRFGQVEGLLQKGADDQTTRSTSFWLLTLIGLACLILIAVVALPFAALTGTAVVAPLLLLLAPVPLIGNLGQVHEAMIRAELRYRSIAIRNVVATIAGASAAAVFAWHDFGVYALVAQKLVFTIVYTLSVWFARPWHASRIFARPEARRLLSTGLDVSIGNTLQIANGRIVDLGIGFFVGVVALGITRVAWRLYDFALQLIIAPLSSVSFSVFARARGDIETISRTYLRYSEFIALVTMPLFIGMSILARDMIVVLAGDSWEASANILSLLSLSVLASCLNLIFSPIMVATGNTRILRRQAIWQTVANILVTTVSAQFGVMTVVIVYVLRLYVFALWNITIINTLLGVTAGALFRRLIPILIATAGLGVCGLAMHHVAHGYGELIRMALVIVAGASAYGFVLVAGDLLGFWPRFSRNLFAMAMTMLRRKPAPPPAPPA